MLLRSGIMFVFTDDLHILNTREISTVWQSPAWKFILTVRYTSGFQWACCGTKYLYFQEGKYLVPLNFIRNFSWLECFYLPLQSNMVQFVCLFYFSEFSWMYFRYCEERSLWDAHLGTIDKKASVLLTILLQCQEMAQSSSI